MRNYSVFVSWSEEDGRFLAETADVENAIADGATREEALAALGEVVAELLRGRRPPRPLAPADALIRLRDNAVARFRAAAPARRHGRKTA